MTTAGNSLSNIIEQVSKYYGLDKDVFTRYGIWLRNILVLDFGTSTRMLSGAFR